MTAHTAARRSTFSSLRGARAHLLVLPAVMALLAAVVFAGGAEAEEPDTAQVILDMLEEGSTGGTVGFYLKQVDGPVHLSHNESFVFEPASAIKALIHFHAMRQVEDGTVIDGQPVTSTRQIPWMADATKFVGGTYDPGGADCPTDNTEAMNSSLATMAQWMMGSSDNATTQGLREFFDDGNDNINATRVALGMHDTALNHVIGCGGPTPNELTLVDASKLYEAAATSYLTDPQAAYQFMFGGGMPGAAGYNVMIDEEVAGLGLSATSLSQFKARPRLAGKSGSYDLPNGKMYRANAGWTQLDFKDTNCATVPREFVFGGFLHATDQAPTVSLSDVRREMMRPQIRAALESWVACEADLEVAHVSIVDPPAEIDVNTPVTLTVRHEVVNNGPAATMDAELSTTIAAPADCTVQPGMPQQSLAALAAGTTTVVDTQVTIACADPSFHAIDVDAAIAPANPAVVDRDPTNNADATSQTVAVIAHADLAVTGLDLAALDDTGLGDLLVGQDFTFDAPVSLHNFGDTSGLYSDPVDGDATRSLVVPAGVTGSVHVTTTEAPATVVVEPDGEAPAIHANQATGSAISATGPATLTVHSSAPTLEVGADREMATTFGLHCDAPGLHEIGLAAAIEPSDEHVVDPQAGNDALTATRTIDCVTPVQINIRPGNDRNFLNPVATQTVPVAILTTAVGEYGLPLAFDATTVQHPSVRFATTATLDDGDGSRPHPDRGFVRDSFEMDDRTKDGDDDMVLLFTTTGTGIDDQTTETCAVGTYEDEDGMPLTFYGCDAVNTTPGGG